MIENLSKTPLGRFRIVAFLEGVSFVILVFIGMPLKYWAKIPQPVKYIGWAHGVLFILFIVTLLHVMIVHRWSIVKGIIAFVASLIPFGTFVLDAKMLKEEKQN